VFLPVQSEIISRSSVQCRPVHAVQCRHVHAVQCRHVHAVCNKKIYL